MMDIWENIKLCLDDQEDGQGYLWDYISENAEKIRAALEAKAVDLEILTEEIEDIVFETHDIDVKNRTYAENIVEYLASQGHLTCQQNTENLTRSDDALKNQGKCNTFEPIEGLDGALRFVEQAYADVAANKTQAVLTSAYGENDLNCIMQAARAYHALSQGQAGWMPIETAPRDGTFVDLYCKFSNEYGDKKYKRCLDVQWGDLVDTLTGDLYQGWRMQYDRVWDVTPLYWSLPPQPPTTEE